MSIPILYGEFNIHINIQDVKAHYSLILGRSMTKSGPNSWKVVV